MTAYENFQYDKDNRVSMVAPALPQEAWAFKVFEFMDTLQQELDRHNRDDGYHYEDGYVEAVEQLSLRFKEIFEVEVN